MDLLRKKEINLPQDEGLNLRRCLSAFDLTLLGIGAIIGAGIFVVTGIVAATLTGPGIIFSYIIAGFACGFAALAYAELAASVGGCGSAYGYAYVGFGELIAWIIGWDLLLEYAISVSAVSVGWSGYFNDILLAAGVHIPNAILHGPLHGGVANVMSVFIIVAISLLMVLGIKSSARANNFFVLLKVSVILLFIVIASSNFDSKNWQPFLPFGWTGVMKGASLIFFAYLGFDAVSTATDEARNPQRDMPIGIVGSLLICTVLYILVSGLLTGVANYRSLNVESPISHTLLTLGYPLAAGMIAVAVVVGLATVLIVLFYGLSRIFLAMAHDGLLPRYFAVVNERTRTPLRIILTCCVTTAFIAAFLPLNELAELVNIGTLFAFALVCGGVIILRHTKPDMPRPFKTPLMPYVPILGIVSCFYLICHLPWITILRFIVWMFVGLIIYFLFSRRNSRSAS